MKRRMAVLAITVMTIITMAVPTVLANSSPWFSAPASKTDKYASSDWYRLKTTQNTCYGNRCYTYYKDAIALPSGFANASDREMIVYLMEDDIGDDDQVTSYTCKFRNGAPTLEFTVKHIMTGNIEAYGDDACELYIRYKVNSDSRDTKTAVPAGLFKYEVRID